MASRSDLERERDALKQDMERLRADASRTAHTAMQAGTDAARGLDRATLEALLHQVSEEATALTRDKPLLALALAFAAGYVLGRATR